MFFKGHLVGRLKDEFLERPKEASTPFFQVKMGLGLGNSLKFSFLLILLSHFL
jgi:hypothetical protein